MPPDPSRSVHHAPHLDRAGDELLAEWAHAGDTAARERLVLRHQGLARRLARRYRGAGIPEDDLTQAAVVALIVAIDRFRSDRGVRFTTYAAARIHGELRHALRDHGWAVRMPRDLQDASRAAVAARDRLSHRLGRMPTHAELADALGTDAPAVAEALAAREAYWTLPALDDSDVAARPGRLAAEDAGLARAEDRAAVAAVLPQLSPDRRRLVHLRFDRGLTQSAIAEELGVSQMQVSRLLASVVVAMRELMEPPESQAAGDGGSARPARAATGSPPSARPSRCRRSAVGRSRAASAATLPCTPPGTSTA